MLSIKEYAKDRNISYEAVRQSINRHKDELKGHITKQGKSRYLDDIAVGILDKYRTKGNVSVIDLKEDKSDMVDELKNQIILLQRQIIDLQSESQKGIEARTKLELMESNVESLKDENKELKKEVQSYKRTIFGFYRKVAF